MDKTQEPQRLKGELSREDDTRHLARHARPTRMATIADSQRAWRDTAPTGSAHKGNASSLASVGDLAKSKTKRQRLAEHRECIVLLRCLWLKVGKPTERNKSRPQSTGRTAWQNRTICGINRDIKRKTITGFDEMF